MSSSVLVAKLLFLNSNSIQSGLSFFAQAFFSLKSEPLCAMLLGKLIYSGQHLQRSHLVGTHTGILKDSFSESLSLSMSALFRMSSVVVRTNLSMTNDCTS